MAKRIAPPEGGMHVVVENEDWIAISGTTAELERLGRLIIEFAQAAERDCAILDSPSQLFRAGSLGLTLYRTPTC
jgi:hypothetical protein